MVHWYKFVLFYLWIAPHVLLASLSVLMFLKDLHRKYPLFFVYTLYETLGFLLRFAAYTLGHGLGGLYRYVFLVTGMGSIALRFGIIQEIFNSVFHDYPHLSGIARISVRWITGILFVSAAVLALYSSGAAPDNLLMGITLLDRSVATIQAGLLLFLFLFSRVFGLSWFSYTFGIAFGFGVFASTELAFWAIRLTDLTEHSKDLLDLLPTGSYHISVLVWLGYLLKAETPVSAGALPVPEIEQWSGELERSR